MHDRLLERDGDDLDDGLMYDYRMYGVKGVDIMSHEDDIDPVDIAKKIMEVCFSCACSERTTRLLLHVM